LLDGKERKSLRVYNLGVATHVPSEARAVQRIGTTDALGLVNSSHAGLGARGTRIEEGMSHLAGSESMWRFGDSSSTHAWKVESFADAFPAGGAKVQIAVAATPVSREAGLRALSDEMGGRVAASQKLADRHGGFGGTQQLLGIRLRHDAVTLKLQSERALAMADWLSARRDQNREAMASAKQALVDNRAKRRQQFRALHEALVVKNAGTDQVDYAMMFGTETFASMDPIRMWSKWTQGLQLSMELGHRMAFNWSEAMISPLRRVTSDQERAAQLTDEVLKMKRPATTPTARKPTAAKLGSARPRTGSR
jgi:hypothetical protein